MQKIKILGVIFGTIPVEQDNWQPKLNKLEKSINFWKVQSLSLLGKSTVVNVLGISKLLYLAKVLIIPAWVISRVNQIIWPFLWRMHMETVSRATCFLKSKFGGISICNLLLKSLALMLASLVAIIDSSEDSGFFLCKYFVGRHVSTLRSFWGYLRDNSSPSTALPAPFYASCLKTLTFLDESTTLTSKKIYEKLLSVNLSPPQILSRWWVPYLSIGFSLNDHWSFVQDSFCENYKNDVLWLILLWEDKVRDSPKRWGCIDNDLCATCIHKETTDHCFINCFHAKQVWGHFAPSLSRVLGVPFTINVLFIFFFAWVPVSAKRPLMARYLIKSILYGIWVFRNKATFHNSNEDHRAIIRYIASNIRNRLNLDLYRLSESKF